MAPPATESVPLRWRSVTTGGKLGMRRHGHDLQFKDDINFGAETSRRKVSRTEDLVLEGTCSAHKNA